MNVDMKNIPTAKIYKIKVEGKVYEYTRKTDVLEFLAPLNEDVKIAYNKTKSVTAITVK
jgi:hypothetical protein